MKVAYRKQKFQRERGFNDYLLSSLHAWLCVASRRLKNNNSFFKLAALHNLEKGKQWRLLLPYVLSYKSRNFGEKIDFKVQGQFLHKTKKLNFFFPQ